MSILEPITYDRLRWELTTKQLIGLANAMNIDISDIPKNRKEKLAKKIWKHCGRNAIHYIL